MLAARILAEVGDDPNRFETVRGVRAFAGTAPTRASGRSRYVKARKVRNKRLADACRPDRRRDQEVDYTGRA